MKSRNNLTFLSDYIILTTIAGLYKPLSGTNDKAGSVLNLIHWFSPRLIKETWVPPTDYRYPFLGEK